MPVGLLVGGATIGSAIIGSNTAKKAAKAQAQAAAQAREDQMPFMIPGQGAMASLARLYGIDPETGAYSPDDAFNEASLAAFRRSPDYQFALREGIGAVENSQAGRGMLRSGNTLRALDQFGQGLATQTFGNYRGALGQLAQLGAGAAGAAGNAAMQRGAAEASGIVGAGNAWSNALGSLANFGMMQGQMNQLGAMMRPSSYGQPMQFGAPSPYASANPYGYSGTLPGGVGAFPY